MRASYNNNCKTPNETFNGGCEHMTIIVSFFSEDNYTFDKLREAK